LPTRMLRLTTLAICHCTLFCGLATAQQQGGPGTPEAGTGALPRGSASGESSIEESPLTLFYLKDEDGTLVPVPGFTLKDFKELYDQRHGLAPRDGRPTYSLQRLSITGRATEHHAELTIDASVVVRRDGWVRVPLRFDRALLREPAAYKGDGTQFLHFADEGEGYVSWIRGTVGGQHQLTLKMLVPTSSVGDETRLRLFVPRATTSELSLKVPVADARGKVSEGATLLSSAKANGNATELRVLGLGGDFELSWHKPNGQVPSIPTALEAEGTILARIDSRSVETTATLSVQSYGAPFDRFQVRLPADSELIPGSPPGYTVVPLDEPEQPEQPMQRRRVVEIRLSKKTSGPVEVHLTTQRPHKVTKTPAWSELAGFEVLNAPRQYGHVAVVTESDWQVLWGPSEGVRRVDQLPAPLQREDVFACFEYFAQPYSLTARLVPKKTRVSVEPYYLLLVDSNQVRLEATLKYTVRGTKIFALEVELPDCKPNWELDEVGPENLVAVDGVSADGAGMLTIPLVQPSAGQIELRIVAHRTIDPDTKTLSVPLPRLPVHAPGSAAVVVAAADNVRLIPDRESMVGLVRQQIAPPVKPPTRQQASLFYRANTSEAIFASGFDVLVQQVSVEVTSRLRLSSQSASVEQKLAYSIAHEPADAFTLQVPRVLAESDELEILHEGQPVEPVRMSDEDSPEADASGSLSETVPMRIAFPGACIGSCEVLVRYPVPAAELRPGVTTRISVPLVMPRDGTFTGQRFMVTAAKGIRMKPAQGPWSVSQSGNGTNGLELVNEEQCHRIDLSAELENADELGATVVERAWVQTWLTHPARQDRAVFAFTSDRKQLPLILPAGAAIGAMEILLDGQRVAPKAGDGDQTVVPLPGDGNRRRYLLELRSEFHQRPRPGRMSIELPRLGGDVWVRRMYWQLVLPRNEHVTAIPPGFTSEFTWGWTGYFFGRKPLLEQLQLETWVGAVNRTLVPEGTNRYLFSGFGKLETCQLRTAGRSWIVLGASGAALIVGLLLIYVPVCRHPGVLVALAAVLFCVGMIFPEPTLLFSQAASLGLALTLLAGLLERSMARRRQGLAAAEPPSSVLERGSSQTYHAPVVTDSQPSTETAPAFPPPPTPDPDA